MGTRWKTQRQSLYFENFQKEALALMDSTENVKQNWCKPLWIAFFVPKSSFSTLAQINSRVSSSGWTTTQKIRMKRRKTCHKMQYLMFDSDIDVIWVLKIKAQSVRDTMTGYRHISLYENWNQTNLFQNCSDSFEGTRTHVYFNCGIWLCVIQKVMIFMSKLNLGVFGGIFYVCVCVCVRVGKIQIF